MKKLFALLLIVAILPLMAEETPNSEYVSKAVFKSDKIKNLIMSDVMLLTSPGCAIFPTSKGRHYMVAVGMTGTEGKNYVQIMDDVADRPFQELAKFTEVRIAGSRQRTTSTQLTFKNAKESSLQRHEVIAMVSSYYEGFFRSFSKIGQWYSPDGKVFFMAVGGYLDEK